MKFRTRLAVVTGAVVIAFGSATVMEQIERPGAGPIAQAEAHRKFIPWNSHSHCGFRVGSVHYHRVWPFPSDRHTIIANRNGKVWTEVNYGGSFATTTLVHRCR